MSERQGSLDFSSQRTVWTVTQVMARLKQTLEREFFDIWVEGEISNLHHSAARHYYFTLKDAGGQLRAALFAGQARYLRFRLQDGMQVLVRGRISIYETRGELQMYVEHVEPRGVGSLQFAFEQLKQKLAAEGLFDAERKRALPALPRRVGLITSPRGAAVADMIRVLRRRYPNISILLFPVQVQGEAAAGEISGALRWFARNPVVDVLIVGRGGGSLEDLWPFNEEAVARAIAASPVPVISAVGHETDFTIADFVADLRAPTPSAAAELVIRAKQDLINEWAAMHRRLEHGMRYRLLQAQHRLTHLTRHRAFAALQHRLAQREQRVDEAAFRMQTALQRRLRLLQRRVETAAADLRHHDPRNRIRLTEQRLEAGKARLEQVWRNRLLALRNRLERSESLLRERNPLAILQRGYTLVYDETGELVKTPSHLNPGDAFQVRFSDGWVQGEVRSASLEPVVGEANEDDQTGGRNG